MIVLKTMEDVVNNIAQYLTDKLPAVFAQIDTERGGTIEQPAAIMTTDIRQQYSPSIWVRAMRSIPIPPGSIGAYVTYMDTHSVDLVMYETGTDVVKIQNDMFRYVEAIEKLIRGDPHWEPYHFARISVQQTAYGDLEDASNIKKYAVITLNVEA